MTLSCKELETLLMRIQAWFLDTPSLAVTLPQAQERCGADASPCAALLDVLVEAQVLAKSPDGIYTRFFPMAAGGSGAAAPQETTRPAESPAHSAA
jgi:hypothetical protein